MLRNKPAFPILFAIFFSLILIAGCSIAGEGSSATTQSANLLLSTQESSSSAIEVNSPTNSLPTDTPTITPTFTPSPTSTITPTPTATPFEVGKELTIEYLRNLEIKGSEITFEQELPNTLYYQQHLVSYISEGNKIYGLLTIPNMATPEGGFKAIVFNHGYIPPEIYRTTERYTAYVDYLSRAGFVVFKIDYRGHGNSEGQAAGAYFSPGYTIDAITAFKSLQTLEIIDPQGIGMWGHSMAGNLVLRAMLIEPEIKAGVIWAGAVYSYDDLVNYGINDTTYRPPATPAVQATPSTPQAASGRSSSRAIFDAYGRPDTSLEYWQAVSLTENIDLLQNPIQLHHAQDDPVVTIAYSFDLAAILQEHGKVYEFYTYEGGEHNLISPYFDQAMLRTVAFFRENL